MKKDDNNQLIYKLAIPIVLGFIFGGVATFTQVQILHAHVMDIDSNYVRKYEIKILENFIKNQIGCD